MTHMVREYKKNPYLRMFTARTIKHVKAKDSFGEIYTIWIYVSDNVRYMQDVTDVETVQTPIYTLSEGYGDCDDHATALCTMLESVGYSTRFVAIGLNNGPFQHVLGEVHFGSRWIPLETTENKPFGWWPSGVTSRMYSNN